MSVYAMTYRDDAGQRVTQHLLAPDADAAWSLAFDIAEQLPGVSGFAIAPKAAA